MWERWYMLFVFLCMLAGYGIMWAEGPYVRRKSKAEQLEAWKASCLAAHARIARGEQTIGCDQSAIVREGERFIVSLPVVLCEDREMSRRPAIGGKKQSVTFWVHASAKRPAISLTPIDSGALIVTDKRVVFTGATKRREFPIDEPIVDSTNDLSRGIPLTMPGSGRISYFTRIHRVLLKVPRNPEVSDVPDSNNISFGFGVFNLRLVLGLLRGTSPSELI